MKFLFISIALILQTWQVHGQNFATCKRAWTKIGCFKDRIKPSRPLPEMLLNDRDRSSKYHQPGYRLNWNKWSESIHSLACRCAERALQKGYTFFGLQFYGECWSGPFAEFNYSRDGQSDKCIMNLAKPTACVKEQDKECVGQFKANYIYKLTANPGPQSPDVDGGFTPWSNWTACSKTCGGGTKSRERTCTNPEPQGNGRPCEGDTEEEVSCNTQNCDVCDKVMDVGIILDTSSSVTQANFEKVKDFLIKLVDKMPISHRMTHVASLRYNHRPYMDWDFDSPVAGYRPALKDSIRKLQYKPGGTRTDRAMLKAAEEMFQKAYGHREDAASVALVITDGKTASRSAPYSQVLEFFKKNNVKIVAIGVGPLVDNKELLEIAMGKKDNVLHVKEFGDLLSKINDITQKYCQKKKKASMSPVFEIS